jgi:hypothetical protein
MNFWRETICPDSVMPMGAGAVEKSFSHHLMRRRYSSGVLSNWEMRFSMIS